MWKGGDLAFAKFKNGTELRLAISFYGSFFKVSGEKGWYTFDDHEEAAKLWRDELKNRIRKGFYRIHKSREPEYEYPNLNR